MTKEQRLSRYTWLNVIIREGCHAVPAEAHRALPAAHEHSEMHAGKLMNIKDASGSTPLMFGHGMNSGKGGRVHLFVSPVHTDKLH